MADTGQQPRGPWVPTPWPQLDPHLTDASFDRSTHDGQAAWAQWHYCTNGFDKSGNFKGWKSFKKHLYDVGCGLGDRAKGQYGRINALVNQLKDTRAHHRYSFPMLGMDGELPQGKIVQAARARSTVSGGSIPGSNRTAPGAPTTLVAPSPRPPAEAPVVDAPTHVGRSITPASIQLGFDGPDTTSDEPGTEQEPPNDDLLARQLGQMQSRSFQNPLQIGSASDPRHSYASSSSVYTPDTALGSEFSLEDAEEDFLINQSDQEPSIDTTPSEFAAMDILLPDSSSTGEGISGVDLSTEVRHAPLADETVFGNATTAHLIPQYGFLGVHAQKNNNLAANVNNKANSKLFLNTNVPFSAFVCGVQGSGKSHTTSCIMEDCLVPAQQLGVLREPLSALVFSYGLFTGDGAGFSISEAAFLGMPSPRFPDAHVKKIHVLVCETNLRRIRKLYERLPNVYVSAFKLDPKDLDIDLMLTLMNVDESGRMPLYMGAILQIIREMAIAGERFDYRIFQAQLRQQKFSPDQENMLKIRLDLLESFLDLKGTYSDAMLFKPGEMTIMDMSCPFVDVNTACIMFRCGLQRYLQSKATGRLVVLDEAHKYMLDVPGAKALNQVLVDTIRMQRHTGTRVIVSTQEPTLLTDLIALCSVAIIHRFSSPEWLKAIKKHIQIPEEDREVLMDRIEALTTGTAVVYSPNAVLQCENGSIRKGTRTMIKVTMRKRITADGGHSVLAV